jgi:hypothetical protein
VNFLHLIAQKFKLIAIDKDVCWLVFEFLQYHSYQAEKRVNFDIRAQDFSKAIHLVVIFTHAVLVQFPRKEVKILEKYKIISFFLKKYEIY